MKRIELTEDQADRLVDELNELISCTGAHHPSCIALLNKLMRSMSIKKQVMTSIVATLRDLEADTKSDRTTRSEFEDIVNAYERFDAFLTKTFAVVLRRPRKDPYKWYVGW